MGSFDSKMRQRLNDLRRTIENEGEKGVNLIALVNRFAVENGLRSSRVKDYIQMLVHGGYCYERNGRIYIIAEV